MPDGHGMKTHADRWIGVGLDQQIRHGTSNPVVIDGTSLVLWRGATGPAQVWEDRCPHRGTRLSCGFVRGDVLRCIYHGWGYDADGRCVKIPAHPGLTPPKSIRAGTYQTVTTHGIIWANLAPHPAAPMPGLETPGDWTPIRSVYANAAPSTAIGATRQYAFGNKTRAAHLNDDVLLVTVGADLQLMIAVQPIAGDKAGLHVTAFGAAIDRTGLARQLTRLRHAIETTPPADG